MMLWFFSLFQWPSEIDYLEGNDPEAGDVGDDENLDEEEEEEYEEYEEYEDEYY